MIKTYVLDTNVLLDDPGAVTSFDEHNVIIPLIVIEEMDRFKDKPGELGVNAREFSRFLSKFIVDGCDLRKGAPTKDGGTIKVVTMSDLEAFGANLKALPELDDYHGGDNKILQVMIGLTNQAKQEGTPCPILVTRDIQLRVKCSVLNLLSEDRRKGGVPSSVAKLYTGVRVVPVTSEVVQSINEDRDTPISLSSIMPFGDYETLSPNEYVVLEAPDKTVLKSCVYRHDDKKRLINSIRTSNVYKLQPRNMEQRIAIDMLMDPAIKLATVIGKAGSGKTLVALAAGLEQVIGQKKYKTLFVCRPVQPVGRDIGFLPGDKSEKLEPWIAPIKDNLKYLLSNSNNNDKKSKADMEANFEWFVEKGIIEVEAMTYIRGRSISNAYMIIDEAQNLSAHELKTIITRVGEGTKIVLTGDIEQIDNMYVDSASNGLTIAVEKFKHSDLTAHVTLVKGERSALCSLAADYLD